eukprot:899421_1
MRSTDALDLEKRINDKKDLSIRIRVYCSVDIGICTIFWAWALYHVIDKKSPDIGAVTFPLVMISALFGLLSVYYYDSQRDDRARFFAMVHCYTILITHFLLCGNYTAGAILENNKFGIDCYYIIMAMMCALGGLLFFRWSYRFYHLFSVQQTG